MCSIIYTVFNVMPTKQEVKPPIFPSVINHTNTDFSEELALLNKGLKYNFSQLEQQRFLLQILLLAQHVLGTTLPIS